MREWLRTARARQLAAACGAAVVTGGGAVAALVFLLGGSSSPSAAAPPPATSTTSATATNTATLAASPSPTPVLYAGILDGVPMTEQEWQARKDVLPLAIMVDNAPPAYPQAGLDKADLVYEAFVEGGITRFMAVFWRNEAEQVYPVRSARTPFVIWASELGAMYGHAGGAVTANDANAIGQIYDWGIKDLDAFRPVSDSAYYRMEERYAPHNLVANTVRLREAAKSLEYNGPPTVESWPFKADGEEVRGMRVGAFEVDFQNQRYASSVIQWAWDESAGVYFRFQSGGADKDAVTGQQLRFKNVVVMRVPSEVVDFSGHVLYDQFGEGPVTVFIDGRAIEGTWKKKDRLARTRFFDSTGREIAFNRGPIFIEVAGPASLLTQAARQSDLPALPTYDPPGAAPFGGPADDEPAPTLTAVPTVTPSPAPSASPSPRASASPGTTGTAPPASATTTPPASPSASVSPTGTPTPPSPTLEPPPSVPKITPPATQGAEPTSAGSPVTN
ncbi:MAG: DUF3048 domain-containing protein [Chloroflexi bacterium]|nr:DUF3048 domain-containing protein [Chloroflexota bacterium]